MKTTFNFLIIIALISLFFSGCSHKNNEDTFIPVKDLVVADDFNWKVDRTVEISLEVFTNENAPVENIAFEIYNADPRGASTEIAKGATTSDGKFITLINIPTCLNKIWAVGYMSTVEIPIVNDHASYTFGGATKQIQGATQAPPRVVSPWSYLPNITFSSNGVPSSMTTAPIEASFLQRLDATLPEYKAVPTFHPSYLATSNQTDIKIDQAADVWITFVHEGASYLNSMGFFTYPSGSVPQTTAQVGAKTIVFPNASLSGSGGGLQAGNTIHLGVFQPGTTVGWFVVANGFTSNSGVSTSQPIYYSLSQLNPENVATKKQHSILFHDTISDRLLVSFEDMNRTSGSDDDFNDMIFFVTVNPITAVDLTQVQPMDPSADRDGDGITDVLDNYPDDVQLAFNNYTFGQNSWGTLSFEDLWPSMGDYDFNDLVVDYNYNQITKAGNLVKKVDMQFKLRAIGARNPNGFAVELPFASSNITNIQTSHPALFEHEIGSKAVFRFFNSAFDLIPQQPNSFINTQSNQSYHQPVVFSVSFLLTTPVSITSVTPTPPYNPFIFVNGNRSHEIHLPGYTATGRMDTTLFGTYNDDSLHNRWFKTADNLPWAVNIPSSWNYPSEGAQLTRAYKKFQNWAQTSGRSYTDWYLNSDGYRDQNYLYQNP